MTLKQVSKNRMYKNVLGFLIKNSDVWKTFARLGSQVKLFGSQNSELDKYINQQTQTSKGYTGDKKAILASLIFNTVTAARKALVYAIDQNNEVLTQLFSVQSSDIARLPMNVALSAIQNIYDAMNPLADALESYNVSTDDLAAIDQGIVAFKEAQPGTGNARASRKAGTKGIKTTITSIDFTLGVMDDLIIHGVANPELVNEYRNNRKIDTLGVHHTGIVATINDAVSGAPVAGVKMEIAALGKSATSNLEGVAEIIKMKPGLYEVTFSAKGFVAQTLVLKIDRGVKLQASVNLAQSVQEMGLVKAA